MFGIRHYDPPKFNPAAISLNDRVKEWLRYFTDLYRYNLDYFGQMEAALKQDGDTSPFRSVASGASISVSRGVQAVTGSVLVTTINAPAGTPKITLLAVDGFSVDVGGNIGAAKAIAAKMAQTFYWHSVEQKWYAEN